jgi:hypothetical protein
LYDRTSRGSPEAVSFYNDDVGSAAAGRGCWRGGEGDDGRPMEELAGGGVERKTVVNKQSTSAAAGAIAAMDGVPPLPRLAKAEQGAEERRGHTLRYIDPTPVLIRELDRYVTRRTARAPAGSVTD